MTDLRERLALWIERKLPRPKLRPGATGRPRGTVKRIIVFGRMPNPTFDYYFAPRLDAPGNPLLRSSTSGTANSIWDYP